MKPPVFILSTGRCGSTLVQRILNSYPDVTIWGEHRGFLRPMAEQYFTLAERTEGDPFLYGNGRDVAPLTPEQFREAKAADRWQAWLNWFSPNEVTRLFRDHVRSFFHPPLLDVDDTWGFKEIRYGRGDRVIEFLSRLFPDAVFLFLVRNGYDTVTSQLVAWQPQGRIHSIRLERMIPRRRLWSYARNWALQNRSFLEWHASGRIRSFFLRFEDILSPDPVLEPVLRAIGKTWGEDQRRIVESGEGRGSAFDRESGKVRSECLGLLPMLMVDKAFGGLNSELGYEVPGRLRWMHSLRQRPASREGTATDPGAAAKACGDLRVG